MATIVEVTTAKPRVQDVTLKLTGGEAADLRMFINDWYRTQYPFGNAERKRDDNTVYKALKNAEEGKAPAHLVKIAQPVF